MQIAEAFAAALEALPEAIRARLDGGETLDWDALESARISRTLGEAVRDRDRLPEPVETLVQRLVRDVGVVPEDVVRGLERQCAASAWIDWVSVEPEGETYRIRNDRSGEVHLGIPAETVAGYAILAMELATAVHRARERWLDSGDRYWAAPGDALCPLSRCSVRMSAALRSPPESGPEPTTNDLARMLETAWNGQELPLRAELAAAAPSIAGHAVHAPRRRRLAPMTGYRLHACDPEELLWLCALAERAGLGAPGDDAEKPPQGDVGAPIAVGAAGPNEPAGDLEAASEPRGSEPAGEASNLRGNRTGAGDGDPAGGEPANEPDPPEPATARDADRAARPGGEASNWRGSRTGAGDGDPAGGEPTNEPDPPEVATARDTDRAARPGGEASNLRGNRTGAGDGAPAGGEPTNEPEAPEPAMARDTDRAARPGDEASMWRGSRAGAGGGDPTGGEPAKEPDPPEPATARDTDRAARPGGEASMWRANRAGARDGDPAGSEPTNEPEAPKFGSPGETDRMARSEDEAVLLDMQALEERIGAETDRRLQLGTGPGEIVLARQFDELESAASRLPGPVRQRMTACYGLNAMQALIRLQDPHECAALRAEVEAADAGGRAPRWLEELAATLLIDAGAETRDGRRTAGLRLDATEEPDARYLVTEMGTGAQGSFSLAGLMEQVHLNLAFARIAWKALTVLRNAGKEGGWALLEGTNRNVEFPSQEGETLEAAQQIGVVLDRFLDARSDPGGSPSSLQQAAMAADALAEVGPTMRAAAGWPGPPPDSGLPGDVAAMVDMAEALQGNVRAISNRLIAGRMAGFKEGREIQA